jgi:hypothetical protein
MIDGSRAWFDATDRKKQNDARIARIKEQLTGYVAGELCLHCWCEGGHAEHCTLTERLRRLEPRVTAKDMEQVVEMVADAEGIAARLAAVKEKFGLR